MTSDTMPCAPWHRLSILLIFGGLRRGAGALNANHPVYNAFNSQLHELRDLYRRAPDERNRYQLVRHEQRMAQWLQQPAQQP